VVLRADVKYNLLNNVRTELNITMLMRQGSTAKTGKTLQQGSEQRMPECLVSINEEHRAAAAASRHRWLGNQRVAIEK